MDDKSVSARLRASTGNPEQTPSTVETVVGEQPVSEPLRSTGNPGQAPATVETVADNQTVAELLGTPISNRGQPPPPTGDITQVPARPSMGASTEAASQPPRAKRTWRIWKWLRVPGSELMAEKRFAWHASRELLDLYNRVRREEPQLTGRALYARVVIRRSGLDVQAAAGVLRRAEESFCDWPSGSDLKFHDLVQYVVIDEYLRSHVGTVGTRTNMVKVVARIIPHDL